MAKTEKIPHLPIVSADANQRVLAARVATTRSSPCCLQLPRARCPPAYLTQDQRDELSRSRISAVAASKATKPVDDSKDDEDNDEEEVQSIGKKGDDGGDDKQEVKEGGVMAAAKATKPGGDDSKDEDDNGNKEGQKGFKNASWGERVTRSVSSTMVTMTTTMTMSFGERVAKSAWSMTATKTTMTMTLWSAVTHCHCLMK
jgi:hypothetical protein